MDATLILIDGNAEPARACARVDRLRETDELADIAGSRRGHVSSPPVDTASRNSVNTPAFVSAPPPSARAGRSPDGR
jgi:hypothetical protein